VTDDVTAARRPNLLFLFSDQHARRIAGCYGDPVAVTPNLDGLAARGVIFDQAYCPSPICVPSRMSLLTARYPYAQECWTNDDFLASDRPTLAHALGAAGYEPALVGRLHSMGPDQLHGYVRREVGDHSPNWIGVPRHDMGVLADTNDPHAVSVERSGPGQSAYELKDVDVTAAACAYLRALGARRGADADRPFCLTVGFMLPHPPYVARPEDYARHAGRVGSPALPAPAAHRDHPWLAWWRHDRGLDRLRPDAILRARTAYYGLVTRLDLLIGEILAALASSGLAENTLVVYSTDHGDQLGERGLFWKHTFYDESVKVPLILAWPGRLPAGERRAQVVNLVDLTATLLDALGAEPLPQAQGRSFLTVARDARAPWVDETYAEYCTDAVPAWTGGMAVQQRMIRRGRWKLVYYHGYRPQLFDLVTDPHEQDDLAEDARHAAIRDALQAKALADWDPDRIRRRMLERRGDKDVLGAWARRMHPPSQYLWEFKAEENWLGRAEPT
jgi:choline-sulfatase